MMGVNDVACLLILLSVVVDLTGAGDNTMSDNKESVRHWV